MSNANRVYSYLTNIVYLYLLAYYQGGKVVYSRLGEQLGISRQAASQKFKELVKDELVILDVDGSIKYLSNILEVNKENVKYYLENGFSTITIGYLLLKEVNPGWSRAEICSSLDCSERTLDGYEDEIKEAEKQKKQTGSFIYAICYRHRIMYVGSTTDFEQRMYQHMSKQTWLETDGFVVLEECATKDRISRENFYIDLFRPEWNSNKY